MKIKPNHIYLGIGLCAILMLFLIVPNAISSHKIKTQEALCYKFLLSNLSSKDGAILRRLPLKNYQTAKQSLLSESVGLIMLYQAQIGDRAGFEIQYQATNNIFMGATGLLAWEVHLPSMKKEKCSASLDDLRIAAALILAYERWREPKYKDLALALSQKMKKDNLVGIQLVEAYCWNDGGTKSPVVDYSYLDLWSMKTLARFDSAWKPIFVKSKELLEDGLTPAGLFYDKFHTKYKEKFFLEKNLINNLLCSFRLAQMGLSDKGVYDFFKKEWETQGRIRASFDPETALPMASFENISVYAILMRTAVAKNDLEFAQTLYEKISSYQNLDETSYFYGAFVLGEAHSFDNLQTLLAFLEFRNKKSLFKKDTL